MIGGFPEESSIFVNETPSFDNKNLLYNIWSKGWALGYNKIATNVIKDVKWTKRTKIGKTLGAKGLDWLEWLVV